MYDVKSHNHIFLQSRAFNYPETVFYLTKKSNFLFIFYSDNLRYIEVCRSRTSCSVNVLFYDVYMFNQVTMDITIGRGRYEHQCNSLHDIDLISILH